MFAKAIMIVVLFASLLAQTQACLKLHVIENSSTHIFNGELIDNDRVVCRIGRACSTLAIKFFTCEPGFAAYMTPNMKQLAYIAGGNHWRLDVPSVKVVTNNGAPSAVQWDGLFWCGQPVSYNNQSSLHECRS